MASLIPSTVLFRDITAVDFRADRVHRGDVLVAHGVIEKVGTRLSAPPDAEIIHGHRRLLIPGLVDATARLTTDGLPGFDRGTKDARPRDGWLHRTNAALDERSLICTAFAGAAEALRAGTTCLLDAHESPGFIQGSLVRLKDVLLTLGIRSILGYAVREGEFAGSLEEQLVVSRQAAAFGGGETLRMAIATARLDEVSDGTLSVLAELRARHETPFLGQLGRHPEESERLRARFGRSGAERLAHFGLLGPTSAIRVGAWLSPEDRDILVRSGATLVHTPRSDLLAGRPKLPLSLIGSAGALGTAEVEVHVLRELRMASDLAAGAGEDLNSEQLLGLVVRGQELAAKVFGMPLGRIEAGAAADLVLVEYDPAYPITPATLAHHLLRGIGSARVLATMVSGRFLVRDGEITTLDAPRLYEVLRRGAGELHQRLFGQPYPGLAEWEIAESSPRSGGGAGARHGGKDRTRNDRDATFGLSSQDDGSVDAKSAEREDHDDGQASTAEESAEDRQATPAAGERAPWDDRTDEAPRDDASFDDEDEDDAHAELDEDDEDDIEDEDDLDDDEDGDDDDDSEDDEDDEDEDEDDLDDDDDDEDEEDDLDEDDEEEDEEDEEDEDDLDDEDDEDEDDLDDGDDDDDDDDPDTPAPKPIEPRRRSRRGDDAPFGSGIFD